MSAVDIVNKVKKVTHPIILVDEETFELISNHMVRAFRAPKDSVAILKSTNHFVLVSDRDDVAQHAIPCLAVGLWDSMLDDDNYIVEFNVIDLTEID